MKPSVGRIVHVTAEWSNSIDGECLTAIIIRVNPSGIVNLKVFNQDGTDFILTDTTNWHWPERIEEEK